jgi:hypothetical protein
MIANATRPQTQSATVPALISRDLILSEGFKKIRQGFGLFVAKFGL